MLEGQEDGMGSTPALGSGCAETRDWDRSGMNASPWESVFCVSGSCLSQISQRIISVQGFRAGEEKQYEAAVE